MFTVTSTLTRPSASISWFSDTPDGIALKESMTDPLILNKTITAGADNLSKVTAVSFNSYDDYQTWLGKVAQADSTSLLKRNNYIVANSMTLKVEESIDGGNPVIEKMI